MKKMMTVLVLGFITSLVLAAEPNHVMVDGGYVRAMPPTVENTAAYFTLHNHGSETITLVGARSGIASKVELHETMSHEGQLRMMKKDLVEIPSQGSLVLENGGLHLMIMGLHAPLNVGDSAEFVLQFEDGSERRVSLPVQSVMAEGL